MGEGSSARAGHNLTNIPAALNMPLSNEWHIYTKSKWAIGRNYPRTTAPSSSVPPTVASSFQKCVCERQRSYDGVCVWE